jgi:RimJ/RimL family protein N-acetyltransferase
MLIRTADLSDIQDIFEWRNDSFSRSMFLSSEVVYLNEHIDWYQRSLKNPHKKMFIGSINDLKVGVVRFDFDEDTEKSEVSINLNPLLRGNGYGFTLLSKSISVYEQSNDTTLTATIKRENSASLRIFSKCDFHKKSEDDFFYYLIRS